MGNVKLTRTEVVELKAQLKEAGTYIREIKRNELLAERAEKNALYNEAEEHRIKNAELNSKAALVAAKIAGVDVDQIFHSAIRGDLGETIHSNYAVNVRNGKLRIVLKNGTRLKIDIADPSDADWDFTKDDITPKQRFVDAKTPRTWKDRIAKLAGYDNYRQSLKNRAV